MAGAVYTPYGLTDVDVDTDGERNVGSWGRGRGPQRDRAHRGDRVVQRRPQRHHVRLVRRAGHLPPAATGETWLEADEQLPLTLANPVNATRTVTVVAAEVQGNTRLTTLP